MKKAFILIFLVAIADILSAQNKTQVNSKSTVNATKQTTLLTDTIVSTILKENKVGLNNRRSIEIVLPAGYATSKKKYPVVYYLHSIYGKAEWIIGNGAKKLMERAFEKGAVCEFILVVPDCSSSSIGSLYENSEVSGRWLDFITKELVPFIDKKYRTLARRESRGVIGDFMGGRGALKLGMAHADLFSVVYAMHPVALAVGIRPWTDVGVNWNKVFYAKSFSDLSGDMAAEIWVGISQAFLPNPSRPPFYCDFYMKKDGDKIVVDAENLIKAQRGFHLDETLNETYNNLKSLRGLAFDWARYDGNFDHVHAARAFTRKLDDLGVEHEAEEYRGTPWNHTWDDDGRFYTRVLPFMNKFLVYEEAR
jgi:S-formylglutathione hydrolase FrmB